jgi:hypothetical protein
MWTVAWKPSAEQQLAAIWLSAADRRAVTSASNRIDHLLATEPERVGEILFDTVRKWEVLPLGVEFEIVDQDRLVWVLGVWHSTNAPKP